MSELELKRKSGWEDLTIEQKKKYLDFQMNIWTF